MSSPFETASNPKELSRNVLIAIATIAVLLGASNLYFNYQNNQMLTRGV